MKTRHILCLTLLSLLMPPLVHAQNTVVTIGEGTSASYYAPFGNYWRYATVNMIYTAEEIGTAGTIESLSFYANYAETLACTSLKIYLGHTDASSFSSSSDWQQEADLQLVYDEASTIGGETTGWYEIELQTPFEYNGEENLVIVVTRKSTNYSSYSFTWRYTSTDEYQTLYRTDDYTENYGDISTTTSGTLKDYRPNIQISINPQGQSSCTRPSGFTASDISYAEATLSWTASDDAIGYEVCYGTTNDVNLYVDESQGLQTTSYTLSELEGSTTYYCWVRSLCSDNSTTAWARTSFTTDPSCVQPENIQISSITASGAAIQWTIPEGVGMPQSGVTLQYRSGNTGNWNNVTVSGQNYYFLTGLQSGTTYTVRLKSLCGSEESEVVEQSFSTVSCGESAGGSSTSCYVPTYGYYNYNYTQSIYPGSVLAGADTVRGLYWNVSSSASQTRTITIMMGNTNLTSLSTSSYVAPTDMTTVVNSANVSFSSTGWYYIPFTTPFVYDGVSNIVVAVDDNTGSYNSSRAYFYQHTPTVGNSVYWYQDGSDISPAAPSASNYNTQSTVPDIRFDITCNEDCAAPPMIVSETGAYTVSIAWNALDGVAEYIVAYKSVDESEWTTTTTGASTYTFSDLRHGSNYLMRVGLVCTDDTVYNTIQATTQCGLETVPFTERFEGGIGTCWENESNSWSSSTTAAHSGSHSVSCNVSSTSSAKLTTSVIDCSSLSDGAMIDFWYRLPTTSSGVNGTLTVNYRTSETESWQALTVVSTGTDGSNWATMSEVVLPASANAEYYQLQFVGSTTSGYPSIYMDDISVYPFSECTRPSNATVTNITADAANLSWSSAETITDWQVELIKGNDTTRTIVSNTTYMLTNLMPNTIYRVDIYSYCGGVTSQGLASVSFRTDCSTEVLPYVEDFESGMISPCWDTSANWSVGSIRHEGSYGLDGIASMTTAAATGVFDFSASVYGGVANFWYRLPRTSSSNATLTVAYRTDAADEWTDFAVYDNATGDNWVNIADLRLPNSANEPYYQLQFTATPNGSSTQHVYIDDLEVTASNGCYRPEELSLDGISYDQAVISWSGCALSDSYEVIYSTQNQTDATDRQMLLAATEQIELNDLASETTYYVWVRGICGEDTTHWSNPLLVTTQEACASVANAHVVTLTSASVAISWETDTTIGHPQTQIIAAHQAIGESTWTETDVTGQHYLFLDGLTNGTTYNVQITAICGEDTSAIETLTVALPVCGESAGESTTSCYVPTFGYYNYCYTQSIYPGSVLAGADTVRGLYWNVSTSASQTRTITIMMGNTNLTSLSTSSYVAPTDMTTVVNSANISFSSTGWYYIPFTTPFIYDGVSNIVVAVDDNTGSYNSSRAYFYQHTPTVGNSVYWYQDGSDISPAAPSASNYNTQSTVPDIRFDITCTRACDAPLMAISETTPNAIEIIWLPSGGDTVWVVGRKAASNSTWIYDTCHVNTYRFSGLTHGSTYAVRAGVICGDDTVFSTANATTTCGLQSVPFSEGFESGISSCWTNSGSGWQTTDAIYHSGSASIKADASTDARLETCVLDCSTLTNNAVLDFWYRLPTTGSSNHASLKVSYRTGSSNSWNTLTVFNSATQDWVNASGLVLPNSAGAEWYQLRFTASSNNGSPTAYIDDIVVSEISSCQRASDIVIEEVDYSSATISWTGCENASAYEVRYSTHTEVDDAGATTVGVGTTPSVTLNGLVAMTSYNVWVRSICGEDTTLWSSPLQFTTEQSCAEVMNLHIDDLTSTRATLRWEYNTDEGEPVGSVIVAYRESGGEWNEETVSVFDFCYLQGLASGAHYEVQVQSVCVDDTSSAVTLSFDLPVCGEYADSSATSCYVPTYGFYNYCYTQSIYPASVLAGADTVRGLYWNVSSSASQTRTITIMMGNTNLTSLSTSSYVAPTDMTTVVNSANISFSSSGWYYIPFTTPFVYDGVSNIVVAVDDNTGSYNSSRAYFYHNTPTVGNSVYWYQDGSDISPAAPSANSNTLSTVPDIRFVIDCQEETQCEAPIAVITSVDTTTIAVQWASTGEETSWVVGCKADTAAVWSYETVSSNHHTFEGLDSATHYTLRIGTACASDTLFSELEATTPSPTPTPVEPIVEECPIPENLMIDSSTVSSLTVSFTTAEDTMMVWQLHVEGEAFDSIYTVTTNRQVTIEGLASESRYSISVRTVCGAEDVSEWSQTVSGTTLSEPVESTGCTTPTGLTVTSAADNMLLLTYVPGESQTQWQIHVVAQDFDSIYTTRSYRNVAVGGLVPHTTYAICVRALCGEDDISEWGDTIDGTTTGTAGIERVSDDIDVHIYPNPTKERAMIVIQGMSGIIGVTVTDLIGQIVHETRLHCEGNCEQLITVNHLPQGSYFVCISTGDRHVVRKLFIQR